MCTSLTFINAFPRGLRASNCRRRSPQASRRTRATYVVRLGDAQVRGVVFSVSNTSDASGGSSAPDADEYRLAASERARTVVHECDSGTLCTASAKHDGIPFGSHVDYVLAEHGEPVFLLANGAAHTANIKERSTCSLYCQPPSSSGQDGCRTTLVGSVNKMSEKDVEHVRDLYIDTHAHAADALKYPELFSFYKMKVDDVYFVGGYGVVAQWVDAEEFANAEPDPLCFDAPSIISSLNADKEEDLLRLCRVFLEAPDVNSCKMTGLDRLGFDLRVRDSSGDFCEYRVAFREKVANRFDVQSALVKAFQEAWERESGYEETWAAEDARPTVLYYSGA